MPHNFDLEILANIIDGSPIPLSVINKEHLIVHWNTALEALTGLKREEMIGTDGQWRSFYPQKRPSLADLIMDGASPDQIEVYYGQKFHTSYLLDGAYEAEDFFPGFGKDGKWLRFTACPIKDRAGQIIGAIQTAEDVTELKVAEENLRYYLKETTRAQEEERKRISRELHDDTAQVFGSLSRQLDNFIRKNHSLAPSDLNFLKEIQSQLNRGGQDLHRFCQGLRLSVLDDLGLIPALRSLIKGIEVNEGICADISIIGEIRRCPPEVESLLFRIVQEAINNISKHAKASEAHVVIEFVEKGINVTINDNGRGFLLKKRVEELPRCGKLGLAGIQERARLLGGTMEVLSLPGKGTTILVKVSF